MTKQVPTMASELEIDNIASTNVDDTEETLISSFELALVKDLNCNDRSLCNIAIEIRGGVSESGMGQRVGWKYLHVEILVPIRI